MYVYDVSIYTYCMYIPNQDFLNEARCPQHNSRKTTMRWGDGGWVYHESRLKLLHKLKANATTDLSTSVA